MMVVMMRMMWAQTHDHAVMMMMVMMMVMTNLHRDLGNLVG